MRVALHSVLRDGHEVAYERDHAVIPADLTASFERVGIHGWTIWRSGHDLFHLVECDDFEAAMRDLEHDPANERWQLLIGPHVDDIPPQDDGLGVLGMRRVWSLAEQNDEEPKR